MTSFTLIVAAITICWAVAATIKCRKLHRQRNYLYAYITGMREREFLQGPTLSEVQEILDEIKT